ncbi:hypothetical protein Glove_300g56 [Diversispora epigaea]|uniref:TLDc domain-containing protein n=1 Tax=Diversispora epigaea TaxID=1348612 RepID=A0A397HWP7_9GLOM|nr:hypothetical protein Glove_300g56 [Diversispora epigaea]
MVNSNELELKEPSLQLESYLIESKAFWSRTHPLFIIQSLTVTNLKALKTTLQNCLPLIRYFHILDEDIWEKVKPYEKILEKQLWGDMIQRHMFPISQLTVELSSWIDRKSTTYSLESIPYEFQLIFLGSRDGFRPKTFWNMFHGYSGTIVVAKVDGTDETVGGYNPLAWDNSIKDHFMETILS